MRRDSRYRRGIPSILLLFLVSVSVLTPLGGLVRPAEATSSTTMQQYTFQTPGSFFNGQPGPNITVTYRFYPSGTVNWFNAQGGNVSIVIPSLASQTVQFNSTAFWYSISRTIFGNTISATVYFFKLTTHNYPSPNMKIKVDGTSTLAATLSFSLQNVNNAQLIQDPSDPCTISYGGFAGFSWCDAPGIISFNQATSLVTVSLPAGQFSIDPTTIGTSNTITATQYNFQRKVFFCQTRYWAFYSDGSNIVWRTSTDGSSWSGTTSVTAGGTGEKFSTWNDCANSKVYYAFAASTTTFQHRAGTLNSDGTITWDYAEVSITGSFGTEREPTIAKDTAGILWIAFVSYKTGGGKGDYLEVWKCTISGTNCGTGSNWATMAPFPVGLNAAGSATAHGPRIQPLTSGKLSLVSSTSGTSAGMHTRTYSGSAWNAAVGTTSETYIPLETAALAISDTTYFVGVCNAFGSCTATGNIVFWSCAYPCSTTVTATQLNAAGTNDNAVISSDGSQQLVVAYGASGTSTSILYRVSTDGGSSWQTEQTLASSESIRLETLTASYTKGNSLYEFLWKDNAVSSPFNIRFATLSLGSAYSVSPSDDISPALADIIGKGAGKFLTETPPLSDSSTNFFQGFRSLAELISSELVDSISKAAGKFVSETPPISDSASRFFQGVRSLGETPPISDASTRFFQGFRSLPDSIGTLMDSISKSAGKFASEAPPLSDAVSGLFTGFRSIPENLGSSLSDSVSKMAGKFLSETPSLSDAVARLFTGFRGLSETPTLADVVTRLFTGFRGLSESPTVSDALSRIFSGFRGMTEMPTISDALARVFTGFRALTETPTISDALSRVFTGFRALSETPTLSDAVARIFTGFRSMSESLAGMIDSISKSAGKFLSEAPPLSDVANRLFTGFRALTETPTVSDALSRIFTGFRSLAESPTTSEALDRVFTGFRSFSETPTVSDAVARVYNGARALAVNLALADIVSKGATSLIGLTEDLTSTLSDSASKLFTGFRDPSDSIASTLSDVISKSAGKFASEAPPLSDAVSRLFTGFRGLTESPTVSDALSRVFTGFRALTESPTISDGMSRVFTGFRALSETPTLSDVVTRVVTGLGGLSETLTVSDAVSRLFTGFRGTTETPTISDALSRVFTGFRALAESPTISDALARVFTGFRALSETPTVSDTVARVFTGFRSMSESLAGMTDSISKSAGKFLSEAPTLSDIVGRLFTGFRGLTETPSVSDMTARVFTGARTISEDFASVLSDGATRIITGLRGASENLAPSITDNILRVAGRFASISENPGASISDTVTRLAVLARISPEDLSSISDSISRVFAGSRTISEDFASVLSGGATRIITGFRGLIETPAISDMTARIFTGARFISENFGAVLSDSVARFFQGSRGISESLVANLSDSISKAAGKFASEVPLLSDALSKFFTGFRGLTETPSVSDMTARVFTGARTISEDFASVLSDGATRIITGLRGASENLAPSITDNILRVAGRFASISENPGASISDTVTRLAVLARISPEDLSSISDSISRVFAGSRGISESLTSLIADTVSKGSARFVSLTENISATLSDAISRSRAITLRFADASPFSESDSASRLMHSVRDVLDDFYYNTVMPTFASLTRDQTRSGGSNSPLSFFTDLANRLAPGFVGLTGSSSGANATVVAFGTIGAVTGLIALFFLRRRGSACHVLTVAAPPCPRFGAEHKCIARGGHTGTHRCKCGASW